MLTQRAFTQRGAAAWGSSHSLMSGERGYQECNSGLGTQEPASLAPEGCDDAESPVGVETVGCVSLDR